MEKHQNVANIQEKFIVHTDEKTAKIVVMFHRQQLADAYLKLFSGFAWINWTNKYSLGRAWQMALTQCGTFVETKNNKNPGAKYLNDVYMAHKKYWSRIIMTHRNRENTINTDDAQIKQMRNHGAQMIQSAMDQINLVLGRYNEHAAKSVAMQKTQQNTQYATKSVAQTPGQSGAFAMARDAVKRANTVITDKQNDAIAVKSTQIKPVPQKMVQPAINAPQPQTKQPVIYHAQKSVAQPVKQSGTLPAVRDTVKQPSIVKQVEKTRKPYVAPRVDVAMKFNQANKNIQAQSAQMQLNMQQQLILWQLNQFKQNAA